MLLTITPEADLASTYPVRNSPLAEGFLTAFAREGVVAEAVYLQKSPNVLTLYVNSTRTTGEIPSGETIFAKFRELSGFEPLECHVQVHYIDRLTLWHRLVRAIPSLNRSDEVIATGTKLYCTFDSDGAPRPLAILASKPSEPDELRERLSEIIYARLKRHELRGEVTRESVTPKLAAWSELSEEELFALAHS